VRQALFIFVAGSLFCLLLFTNSPCAAQFNQANLSDNQASSAWQKLDEEAQIALKSGHLDEAERLWGEAIKSADKANQIQPGTVDCLFNLALVRERKGNPVEAERLCELAMRNMEGLVGPNSPQFADWMSDLAWLYARHGRLDKAEVLFKRALAIKEKSFGAEDARLIPNLENYGQFLRLNSRSTEADSLEERAKSIATKTHSLHSGKAQ
jgi:tetratricopeptide (TPR) repeat protein